MSVLESNSEAEIIELARGIVTGEWMIADLGEHEWKASLALMIPHLSEYENLGVILVPRGPHISMNWINGKAPGCTISCRPVAREDMPALEEHADRMWEALHPREVIPEPDPS